MAGDDAAPGDAAAAAASPETLAFAHGHLAGQTGCAFALLPPPVQEDGGGAPIDGNAQLVTCGADCNLCLRPGADAGPPEEALGPDTQIRDHEEAVTCVAASVEPAPESEGGALQTAWLATGSEDCFVKLYAYPDAVFETNATRFELPVRAVDFAPPSATRVASGADALALARAGRAHVGAKAGKPGRAVLACGGDDGAVRIVAIARDPALGGARCRLARTLRADAKGGALPAVKCLRWDPEGAFVAASAADGAVRIWACDAGVMAKGKSSGSGEAGGEADATAPVVTRRGCGRKMQATDACCNQISWHPDGTFLCVPHGATGE